MKTILGIDCSSTTIGYCILKIDDQDNIQYIDMDYLKPIKTGLIADRLADTRDKIQLILDKYQPDHIAIEEIIKYMKGKSSANSIIMLATFNRMICLLCRDYLQKSPELFSVMAIRHGLKLNKIFPPKEAMPALISHHLGITFPYIYLKKGKNKGKPAAESFDKADGAAVATYYAQLLTGKIKKKKK